MPIKQRTNHPQDGAPVEIERKAFDIDTLVRVYLVPRTRIFGDIGTGKLKSAKIGKKRLVDPKDAEEWFEGYKAETAQRDEVRRREKETAKVSADQPSTR